MFPVLPICFNVSYNKKKKSTRNVEKYAWKGLGARLTKEEFIIK